MLIIYIRDAKVEVILPSYDNIVQCSQDIAAELVETKLEELTYAATRKSEGGILDGPLRRHKFSVSTDEVELAATLAEIIGMKGNHKPKSKLLTMNELTLI